VHHQQLRFGYFAFANTRINLAFSLTITCQTADVVCFASLLVSKFHTKMTEFIFYRMMYSSNISNFYELLLDITMQCKHYMNLVLKILATVLILIFKQCDF